LTIGPRATKVAKITQLQDDIAYALRWRSPAGFGLLVGLGGLFIGGPVGGAVGFLAGYQVVVRGVRPIFLAAALALLGAAGRRPYPELPLGPPFGRSHCEGGRPVGSRGAHLVVCASRPHQDVRGHLARSQSGGRSTPCRDTHRRARAMADRRSALAVGGSCAGDHDDRSTRSAHVRAATVVSARALGSPG
jgi:hypothetical protein